MKRIIAILLIALIALAEVNAQEVNTEEKVEVLNASTVSVKVPLVVKKVDKTIVNIGQSVFSQGSDALELLRKAPGVVIDNDGNVTLNGKKVSVWIDGRPSNLDGKSLESLLHSTDGGTIDKFELMEHPSAKYDAQGEGGIINIRLKKHAMEGFSGSLGADGGLMYFKEYETLPSNSSIWANFNWRGNKTYTYLNLYANRTQFINVLDLKTFSSTNDDTYTISNDYLDYRGHSYNAKAGTEWNINSNNTVGASVSVPVSREKTFSDLDRNTTISIINGAEARRDDSGVQNDTDVSQVSTNIFYNHVFDEERNSGITFNSDYFHNYRFNHNDQDIYTSYADQTDRIYTFRGIIGENSIDIWSMKADYQSAVGNGMMLEAGAKWALSTTDNTNQRREICNDILNDTEAAFKYREHIAAAYIDFAYQPSPIWSLKAGLRGEYTNIYGDWITENEKTKRQFFNLFPTFYATYNPTENWHLGASYARRINRPNYNSLNPTELFVDAHTYTVGNADLLPEISDKVSLQAAYGKHLAVILNYQHKSNMIVDVPYISPNGNQFLKSENFGKNHEATLVLNISALPVAKWFSWSACAVGMYMGNKSADGSFSKSSLSAILSTNCTFFLPKDWKMEFDANYQSPLKWGYYGVLSQFMSNFGVKKSFLEDSLTLTMKVNDIFRTHGSNIDIYSPVGDGIRPCEMRQKFLSQRVSVGLNWNFGKMQPTRSRRLSDLEEVSRAAAKSAFGQ